MARKLNQLTGWSSNRFRQVQSVKEVQNWRTQEKKCSPEWRGSAPEFFRDSQISATKGINFFSWVQDLFEESFPQITERVIRGVLG